MRGSRVFFDRADAVVRVNQGKGGATFVEVEKMRNGPKGARFAYVKAHFIEATDTIANMDVGQLRPSKVRSFWPTYQTENVGGHHPGYGINGSYVPYRPSSKAISRAEEVMFLVCGFGISLSSLKFFFELRLALGILLLELQSSRRQLFCDVGRGPL
ncbi:hypothetical protein [Aquamicrobium soli]|jgi:hypothetical protein|uniref:Uncharacterized protein n=1 Tax=Aquamicrobium soli TaxID=1811518 RepID=A0ABV7K7Q1_9HYPH